VPTQVRNPASSQTTDALGAVIIHQHVHQAAPDELRPVSAFACEWDLEPAGLLRAIVRAEVPTAKVGRKVCALRSDLLRIVERLAKQEPARVEPQAAYAELVARSGAAR